MPKRNILLTKEITDNCFYARASVVTIVLQAQSYLGIDKIRDKCIDSCWRCPGSGTGCGCGTGFGCGTGCGSGFGPDVTGAVVLE